MNKLISRNIKFLVVFAFSMYLFSSCHGVIFDTIRDEVELADAKISGDIQNIIRYNDGIFISTGKIKSRSVADKLADIKITFTDFPSPSGYIYSLAADASNLYALSANITEDDDGYNIVSSQTLWCYDGSNWSSIWTSLYNKDLHTVLFCTNTIKKENRHAYFRYGTFVYELAGTTPLGTNYMTTGTQDRSTTPVITVSSCTVLGSTVYFSSSYAMTSNETSTSDSTYIYCSTGDWVWYSSDGSTWAYASLSCSTIYSLAVTADYLLAGTSDGIVHTPLVSNVPSYGNASFSTNADSALSSYYEVPALLVLDPLQKEISATIFATCLTSSTSASLNNVGLWSYFATTGEWNRE